MSLHDRDVALDVRELSTTLGDVLAEQVSRDALDLVEQIRTGAIEDRREGGSRDAVRTKLAALDESTRETVARAFTTYFELVNLAEERERVRAIRDGRDDGTLSDSLAVAIEQLAAADASPETVQRILDDVHIQPTFTAHPTEARRKTVKATLRSVATHLEALDERRLTARERERIERVLEAEITNLWQTSQIRDRQPSVVDEARNVQWYLANVLFDVVGDVYAELERVLDDHYPTVTVPTLFEFRSWAGSDRDGNPHVTTEVTTETLARQRRVVLDRYRSAIDRLAGVLSQDTHRVDVLDQFDDCLTRDVQRLPDVGAEVQKRYPGEDYRQKLLLMRERLDRVDDVREGGYADADELRRDLELLAESLRANEAAAVADVHVEPLIRQVETFGFVLAKLDLRDHQSNHTELVAEIFDRVGVDYAGMSEVERVETLTEAILQEASVVDVSDHAAFDGTAARVLERFDALGDWHAEYGSEAIDTYCISMTEEPSHVLEVLFLADQSDVVDLPDYAGIDVVPLLETESALSGADRIMGTLFENEAYRAALDARGGVQEIMLGYSDSNKENGFLAANWSLYRNQKRLAAVCSDHDVTLRLFHGRGGSISRGGGPSNEALLALPTETVNGRVKFTEQGEAIAEKYANDDVARRNVEQMLNAQIRARHRALGGDDDSIPEEWDDAMTTAADAAREAYRDLLDTDGFVAYFERATPIRVIEGLNLGSRPASRSDERTVEDLRAIPWVFSWTQARCILPGWYGLGYGLTAYLEADGDAETLREMYREWPFFRTVLDRAAMELARTDLEIAGEYAALADGRERFFPRIESEYDRCVDLVRTITGRDRLPARSWVQENLERRNPYVDPLNHMQVQLLAGSDRSALEERTLRLTVKGIAAGMKSTG